MEVSGVCIIEKNSKMRKLFIVACFLTCLVAMTYAQQKQSPPPKVDLTKFNPPVKKEVNANKAKKSSKKGYTKS